jgi:hypothetical protein
LQSDGRSPRAPLLGDSGSDAVGELMHFPHEPQ